MKLVSFLALLGLVVACDPYGFGFKKNPAFVLNEAFESVVAMDVEAYVDVTGKEALCLYGNNDGLSYLRNNLSIKTENVEIKPRLIANSSQYTNSPHFVGYWSYYNERYQVDILDKVSKEEFLKVVVECHYGFEGEKNTKYQHMKLKKYKKKECRVIKVIPFKFKPLPMRAECEPLKVTL